MSDNTLSLLVEQTDVERLANRIADFLPGARDVPPQGRLALAHISLAHGLDPFLKEVWAIPVKDKNTKQVIGFELMIGITGWRRTAHESGKYWGRRFEPCTDEERRWLNVGPDDLAVKCVVLRRKTGQQPSEFDGYGIYKKGEWSKVNPLQLVRLRAERDALKQAFPISLAGAFGARVRVVDEETGEIVGDAVEGEYRIGGVAGTGGEPGGDERPTLPEAEPTKSAGDTAGPGRKGNGKRSSWPALAIQAVIKAGLFENTYAAVNALNKSAVITSASAPALVLAWARAYRAVRGRGCTSDEAASLADQAHMPNHIGQAQ